MEDRAVQLMLPAQRVGVDQVAVVAQRHVALDVADHDRLDVVGVLAAGRGIAHMAHSHIALPQPRELVR